ncbi:MAG TPA: hypothetical protein VNH18_14950 [Bryobacteraceae bacterium]|nr:hypothetical protein [Bryobacteraceae bacterium]
MKETLAMCGFAAVPGILLIIHRVGFVFFVRSIGNWWYSLATAVEAFRREFRRLNSEARRATAAVAG